MRREVKSNSRTRDNRLWRRFSQVEQLPQSQRKQIVQILDAFLERDAQAAVQVCERDDAVE